MSFVIQEFLGKTTDKYNKPRDAQFYRTQYITAQNFFRDTKIQIPFRRQIYVSIPDLATPLHTEQVLYENRTFLHMQNATVCIITPSLYVKRQIIETARSLLYIYIFLFRQTSVYYPAHVCSACVLEKETSPRPRREAIKRMRTPALAYLECK